MSKLSEADITNFEKQRVVHRRQQIVFDKIWAALETARREKTVVLLTGPTGVGKTNLIEALELQAANVLKATGSTGQRMPLLSVTAAPPQHDTFRFPDFFEALLAAGNGPGWSKGLVRVSSGKLQTAARNMLRNRRPFICCVDEAQHITYAVRDQRLRAHLDLIKWLASETPGVPILLVGTGELVRFARLSGQLGRRIDCHTFTPYRFADEDKKDFRAVLRYFCKTLPARMTFDALERDEYFFEGSAGAVGILKPWFDRALRRCAAAGRSNVTLEDFEETCLEYGRIETIAEEQNALLDELAALRGSRERLRARLGLDAPPKRTGGNATPGVRKPTRDPVGLEEAAA